MRIAIAAVTAAVCMVAMAVVSPAGAQDPTRSGARTECQGLPATIVGTPDRDQIVGTPQADVIVGLGGDDSLSGRGGNDVICGGGGFDVIKGGAGADIIIDNGGRYASLVGGVGDDIVIDNSGSHANLIGGAGDDALISAGNPAFPLVVSLEGGPGDDRLVLHGPGTLHYDPRGHPIHVDLRAGTASGQGHDQIRLDSGDGGNIDGVPPGSQVRGTPYDDTMYGSGSLLIGRGGEDQFSGNSRAYGGPGNDVFDTLVSRAFHRHLPRYYGNDGQDTFRLATPLFDGIVVDGGAGAHDEVYLSVERPVQSTETFDSLKVDLDAGLVAADATSFPLFSIGAVHLYIADVDIATSYEIEGTDGANFIAFAAATPFGTVPPATTVRARQGDDAVVTTGGDDHVYGGAGDDSANTDEGTDTCVSVEHATNCELLGP